MSIEPTDSLTPPSSPTARRAWVIYQLRLRGRSLTSLARENGVTAQAVSNALVLPSSHLEKVIAGALGLSVPALFPERFSPNGQRLTFTRAPERNMHGSGRNRRSAGAA